MPVWQPVSDQPEGAGARVRRGGVPRSATRSERRPPAPASGTDTLGGTLSTLSALPAWQGRLAMMAACTLPGVLMRLSGVHLPPPLAMVVFGGAVMAAAFMLASAAEAAELDVSPGIAVAGIAFVAVLPEYVIEVYFAFSGQVEFVTASLTGSTRLLLAFAVGMPALASFVLVRRGKPRVETVEIDSRRRIDLADHLRGFPLRPPYCAARASGVAGLNRPDRAVRRVHAPHRERRPRAPAPRRHGGRAREAAKAAAAALGRRDHGVRRGGSSRHGGAVRPFRPAHRHRGWHQSLFARPVAGALGDRDARARDRVRS